MLEQIFSMIFTTSFGYSIIRITSPILFAALAAVVAEKAGVTNIGLEGIMMISALFGVLFAYWTSYWWVGVIGAVETENRYYPCRDRHQLGWFRRYHFPSVSVHRSEGEHSQPDNTWHADT